MTIEHENYSYDTQLCDDHNWSEWRFKIRGYRCLRCGVVRTHANVVHDPFADKRDDGGALLPKADDLKPPPLVLIIDVNEHGSLTFNMIGRGECDERVRTAAYRILDAEGANAGG